VIYRTDFGMQNSVDTCNFAVNLWNL